MGLKPNITSTFAKPISASKIKVFFPKRDKAIARFTEKLVLPTPPLPLVMAIGLQGSSKGIGFRF